MSGSRKRHVRRYVVLGFIVVLVVAGYFAYRVLHKTSNGTVTYTTQAVQQLTITSSVSGTGNIVLSSSASVNPSVSGTVSALQVAVGDTVTKGQTLFTVVNPQLDLDVANATNSYNQAVDNVQKNQLSVLQAQQALDQLQKQRAAQSSSSAGQVASGAEMLIAGVTSHTGTTGPTSTLPSTTSTSATESSSSSTSSTEPPTSTTSTSVPHTTTTVFGSSTITQPSTTTTTISALQIEIAQQQVTSAKLSVTAAQAQVQSATLALEQAKATAAERTVTAPIDGVVTALNVQNGDALGNAGSGGSSSAPIVITNVNSIEAVISLAETDVPNVAVGQKAIITFDALPDLTLAGKVEGVDSQGTNSQGVVTYNATILPDATNPSVKGGMSVTVNIITKIATDALVVPNVAVKTQTGGGSYVQVLQNGQPTDVAVEVGISNDTFTQITSGLTLGEEVITQTINPSASTSTTARGGGNIPGLGGGGIRNGGGGFVPPGG